MYGFIKTKNHDIIELNEKLCKWPEHQQACVPSQFMGSSLRLKNSISLLIGPNVLSIVSIELKDTYERPGVKLRHRTLLLEPIHMLHSRGLRLLAYVSHSIFFISRQKVMYKLAPCYFLASKILGSFLWLLNSLTRSS